MNPAFERAKELGMPALGAPCNGCGFCCEADPCAIAKTYLLDHSAPCKALERSADRTWCGLVLHPSKYLKHHGLTKDWADTILGAEIAGLLGVGRGCDAGELPHD